MEGKRPRIIRSIGETFRRDDVRKKDEWNERSWTTQKRSRWRGTVARALQHSLGDCKKVSRKRYRTWRQVRNESLAPTCNDYNGTESTTAPVYRLVATLKPLERGENDEEPVYTMFGNCYHAASTTRQPRARLWALRVRARSCAPWNSKKSRKKPARIKCMHTRTHIHLSLNRCSSVSSSLTSLDREEHYSRSVHYERASIVCTMKN